MRLKITTFENGCQINEKYFTFIQLKLEVHSKLVSDFHNERIGCFVFLQDLEYLIEFATQPHNDYKPKFYFILLLR